MTNKLTFSFRKYICNNPWGEIKKVNILVFTLLLHLTTASYAQTEKNIITGTVYFEDGTPLPGASIRLKGTTAGASTDFDGRYTISVASGQILVFSYLGMTTSEIVYTNQKKN